MSRNVIVIASRLRALLVSPSVPSRQALKARGWHGYALDDSQLATDEALAILDGYAALGVTALCWCLADELFGTAERVGIRSLPFDLTLLDAPPFCRDDALTWYSDRVVFDEELRAIVLVPADGHRFFAGPEQFIRAVSADTAGNGAPAVSFLGTDFCDPELCREFAHELDSRAPDRPCAPGPEMDTPPLSLEAIEALIDGGRFKADALRRVGWSLGVRADIHDRGFASIALARAFLALGAPRLLVSRLSRPERAVPVTLEKTCIAHGIDYGPSIAFGASDAESETSGASAVALVYPDDLAACVLVMSSGSFVFAGSREFVESASRLRFDVTDQEIVSDYPRRVTPSQFVLAT